MWPIDQLYIELGSISKKDGINAVYIPNAVNTTYPLIIAIRAAKNGLVTDRLKYRILGFPNK